MDWKKKLYVLGVVLLCTSVLATVASANNPNQHVKKAAIVAVPQPGAAAQLKDAVGAQNPVRERVTADLKDAAGTQGKVPVDSAKATKADPEVVTPTPVAPAERSEVKALSPRDKATAEIGKEVPLSETGPASVAPVTYFPDAGQESQGAKDSRDACVGDIIMGATTTGNTYQYPVNGYYNYSRTQSLFLRSEFSCSPYKITQLAVNIYTASTMNVTNCQIWLKKVSDTTVPTTWDSATATSVYGPVTVNFTPAGWKVFDISDFIWDTGNLLVMWQWNGSYSSSRPYFYYTASFNYGTAYGYSDTAFPSLSYTTANRPQYKFTFEAPPPIGACCNGYTCTPNMIQGDCVAGGGVYQGNGSVCSPNPCQAACCYFDTSVPPQPLCVDNSPAECAAIGGSWKLGNFCATFNCPPWNDSCSAVTPVLLAPGVPVTFTGSNLGATNDCAGFPGGNVWVAFTVPAGEVDAVYDVKLDYCGSSGIGGAPFGNVWLNLTPACPCSTFSAGGTWDNTTCGDGNITIRWAGLTAGNYWYPVLLDPAYNSAGTYNIHVSYLPGYCASAATSTADENIQQFVIGSFTHNNPTSGWCDLYNNFTNETATVVQGSTYPISLTIGDCESASCYSKQAAIFVDYNHDFDFTDAGEMIWTSGQLSNTPCPVITVTGNITVPAAALLGATRMRVVVVEGTSVPAPCGTYTWGATEDFTLVVAEPLGACCVGETCSQATPSACVAAGGNWQGLGTLCDPNPCELPTGACCFPNGTCSEIKQPICIAQGGVSWTQGVPCTPTNPCPQPLVACCYTSGLCAMLTAVDCTAGGGTPSAYPSTCTPNTCPQPGDDCGAPAIIPSLPYSVEFNNDTALPGPPSCNTYYTVTQNDWWFKYVATDTVSVLCHVQEVTSYDVVMGVYTGPDCNNLTNILCLDDPEPYNVTINMVAGTTYWFQIGDYGSTEGGGVTDFTLTPDLPGACCFSDGSCQFITTSACSTAGGTFQGVGITCAQAGCQATYCVANATVCDEYISRVQIGTIDNSTACTSGGYANYTALSTNLVYTVGTPITVTNGLGYSSDQCKVWVDWNHDMDFTDADEGFTMSGSPGYGPYTGSIVAPNSALAGPTRMRIRITYTGALEPCGTTYYGEVEDYTVNVVEVEGACCTPEGCTSALPSACTGTYGGAFTVCAGTDCNNNGVDDFCDLLAGMADCNQNGILDVCEPGYTTDCNENGIPDFCDLYTHTSLDCNENGIPDECDIDSGTSLDCQPDGIPDECQLGGGGGGGGMVYDAGVCDGVNGGRPTVGWNDTGVVDKFTVPQGTNGLTFNTVHIEILDFSETDMPAMQVRMYALPTGSIPTDLASFAAATSIFDHTYTVASGELVITPRAECYPGAGAWDYNATGPSFTFTPGSYAMLLNFPGSGAVNYWASTALNAGGGGYVWGVQVDAPSAWSPAMSFAWNISGGGGGAGGDCNGNGIPDDCDIMHGTSQDCNLNGIPDECEPGYELDCNNNGIPDFCDLYNGTSQDCNQNGIPDECEPGYLSDCNENGIPDFCDLYAGTSQDCNQNGIPDECDIDSGTSLDCQPDGIPDECQLGGGGGGGGGAMVYDAGACDGVNGTRPTVGWNDTGLVDAFAVPQGTNGLTFSSVHVDILDFSETDMPAMEVRMYALPTGSILTDLASFAAATPVFDHTYTVASGELVISARAECYPGAGAWNYDATGPSYTFTAGSYAIFVNFPGTGAVNYWASAADDGFGNGYVWGVQVDAPSDAGMALAWNISGGGGGAGGDCNGNGIPDDCDISHGTSLDCNFNGIPDECELAAHDCNGNGIPDDCDIGSGYSQDCNANGIPDECDIASGTSQDCNSNLIPDECDIASGLSQDCNNNGQPDECDISGQISADCNHNGIPDECELGTQPGGQLLLDPGFEAGVTNPYWASTSSNFGTVLCDSATCGTGGGTSGAHGGLVWAWFGGAGSTGVLPEIGTLSQSVVIPSGPAATLSFYFWIGASGGAGADTFTATVDGNTVFAVTDADTGYPAYTLVSFALAASYSDGNSHTIEFTGIQTTGTSTNFNLDDVTLEVPGGQATNDCNNNGIPDICDIQVAFGGFCQGTAYPPCDTDYNHNGVPDHCEICGDFTGSMVPPHVPDGVVGAADYWYIHDGIGACVGDPKYTEHSLADLDGDGCITLVDYQSWLMCYRMQNGKVFVPPKKRIGQATPVPVPSSNPKGSLGMATR